MSIKITIDLSDTITQGVFGLNSSIDRVPLVKTLPNIVARSLDYFRSLPKECLMAGTITLAVTKLCMLNYLEQYEITKRIIKKAIPYHGIVKYLAFPEIQKNGNIHWHLILTNEMYMSEWCQQFGKLGSRNKHKESYKKISDTTAYLNYIKKDYGKYPRLLPITNVSSTDIEKKRIHTPTPTPTPSQLNKVNLDSYIQKLLIDNENSALDNSDTDSPSAMCVEEWTGALTNVKREREDLQTSETHESWRGSQK